jgi:hypothetical protein
VRNDQQRRMSRQCTRQVVQCMCFPCSRSLTRKCARIAHKQRRTSDCATGGSGEPGTKTPTRVRYLSQFSLTIFKLLTRRSPYSSLPLHRFPTQTFPTLAT